MNDEDIEIPTQIYLHVQDFKDGEVVTIGDLNLREFENPDGSKRIVVQIKIPEKNNGIISLNKTTTARLSKVWGTSAKNWIGRRIRAKFEDIQYRRYGKRTVLTFEPVEAEEKKEVKAEKKKARK